MTAPHSFKEVKQRITEGCATIGIIALAIVLLTRACEGDTVNVTPTAIDQTPYVLILEETPPGLETSLQNEGFTPHLLWSHCVAVVPGDNDPNTADTFADGRSKTVNKNGGGRVKLFDGYNPDGTIIFENENATGVETADAVAEKTGGILPGSEICPDGVPFSSLAP